jgi:segregation and condensation protein B
VGRLETVGRPILYGVTEHFMHHFGLVNMDELPPLRPSEQVTTEQP